ncbi:hypothetical protein AALP_AA6G133600 [Arabis alpina]|uniref:Transmembrane protein n=1 Tax=Arabis alpina TaxID=50452 RepID=A0A087GNZ5_ARAAL|nr:hypothetical protein AALP_AA6G133600 [Arabis alpina]
MGCFDLVSVDVCGRDGVRFRLWKESSFFWVCFCFVECGLGSGSGSIGLVVVARGEVFGVSISIIRGCAGLLHARIAYVIDGFSSWSRIARRN